MPEYLKNYARLEFWDRSSTWVEISRQLLEYYSIDHQDFPSRSVKRKTSNAMV